MAQPEASSNVLTTLDDRVPTSFYWQLTLLATLGGFLFGYDTSNIGSALNFVPYNLHGLAPGYLVSGASLGAAAGAILAGPLSDHFGRKTLLVVVFVWKFLPETKGLPVEEIVKLFEQNPSPGIASAATAAGRR